MTAPEYRLGNPNAKVVLVEYASDTCPHCARFAAEVFPTFKKKYVDTGKVLYIFREYPTDPVQISAAGFVLARCTGQAHYYDVINALFQAQTTSTTVLDFLLSGAKAAGLNEAQMKACLSVKEAFDDLNARVRTAEDVAKIRGTPTFLLNGVKLSDGEKTMKQLDDALAPLLAKRPAKRAHPSGKA